MKELIMAALNAAAERFEKAVPQTKRVVITINIDSNDITPLNIGEYMVRNNVPNDAWFSTTGDEGSEQPALCYDKHVPTTEADKLAFRRKAFHSRAFKAVYDALTENGYKRVTFIWGKFEPYKKDNVWDLYCAGDFDRLTERYSLFFVKL